MKKQVPWNKGLTKETDERVKKQSEARIGVLFSEERKQNLRGRKFIYNEKLDDELRIKKEEIEKYLEMGYKLGRRPFSDEAIQNISKGHEGIIFSEEQIQNMRKATAGENNGMYGKHHSEEAMQKNREAQMGNTNVKNTRYIYNEELDKEKRVKEENLTYWKNKGYVERRRPRSEEAKKNIRLAHIKRIENSIKNNGQISPWYNSSACKYFDLLMEQTKTYIQHAENGGEYRIKELGYWVDGYDKKNNIVYEYDEEHHYENGILRKRDVQRQKEITEHLNCKFIRIKA